MKKKNFITLITSITLAAFTPIASVNAISSNSIDVDENKVSYNYTDPNLANAEIADLKSQIYALEQQNAELQNKLNNIQALYDDSKAYWNGYLYKCSLIFDLNRDGVVDASDSSMSLSYYAYTSVGYDFKDNYYEFIYVYEKR